MRVIYLKWNLGVNSINCAALPQCLPAAFCAGEQRTGPCGGRRKSWVRTTRTTCRGTRKSHVNVESPPEVARLGHQRHILGQRLPRWVNQALPVGWVCQEVGQDGAQQGQRDLLHVQAEDAVEQLHHPIGPFLASFLQQLLKRNVNAQLICFSFWLFKGGAFSAEDNGKMYVPVRREAGAGQARMRAWSQDYFDL